MSNVAAPHSSAITTPVVTAEAKTIGLLVLTAFLALMVIYFIGIDEGATSVFGNSMVVHEFFHDGRHFLGFPCH
jgi:cobalt transporter subunit CbtB